MSSTEAPPVDQSPERPSRDKPQVVVRVLASWVRENKDTLRLFAVVAILWIVMSFLSTNFLTFPNIRNILVNAAPLALVATGLTLVIISGQLDLSVGSTIALVSTATALFTAQYDLAWYVAIVAGLLVGMLVGCVNAFFATKLNVPSFIVTLATLSVVRGVALVLSDGSAITGLAPEVSAIARTSVLGLSLVIWIPALIIPVFGFTLSKTTFGLNIYAVGGNDEAARLAGVSVHRIRALVLILSGFMAGVAGILTASRLGIGSPIVAGEDLLLDAIAAVVIGGTSLFGGIGRVGGTILGVVLISTIRNGLVLMNVSAFYQRIAIGVVILLAASLDAYGRTSKA